MSSPALAPCDAFVAPLGARAVGGLDDAGRAALEAHLATGCAGCAALAADLEAALDAVRLPEEEPAPGGWERVRLRLDDSAAAAPAEPVAVKVRCTYCKDDLAKGTKACCAACLAPHHADCFAEHGRCAAPGCAETRTLAAAPNRRPTRRLPWLLGGALVLAGGSVAAWEVADRKTVALESLAEAAREKAEADAFAAFEEEASKRPRPTPPAPEPLYEGQPLNHWLVSLTDRSPKLRDQAKGALLTFGEAAVPGTIRALGHAESDVRLSACYTLGEMREQGRASIAALTSLLLADGSKDVRATSAGALAAILGSLAQLELTAPELPAAGQGLAKALVSDPDAQVRVSACGALSNLPEYGRDALVSAIRKDPEEAVRMRAALNLLYSQPTTPAFVAALAEAAEHDQSEELRHRILVDLLRVEPAELRAPARAAVLRVLVDPSASADLRQQAAEALAPEPQSVGDLVALARAAPDVPRAGTLLGSDHGREPLQGLLRVLPTLPEPTLFHALALTTKRLIAVRADPDGALLAPLLRPAATPRVRYRAAHVALRSAATAEERKLLAGRLAPLLLPDLPGELDTLESSRSFFASAVVVDLGAAAAPATDMLAARAVEHPKLGGQSLELLACVAPTDSRLDALTAAAVRRPDQRFHAMNTATRLGARVGPKTLSALCNAYVVADNDVEAGQILTILEQAPERIPSEYAESLSRSPRGGELIVRVRALLVRARADRGPTGPR